jgi:cyclophilin family peptidyl-prolyl cis-trans isomerase
MIKYNLFVILFAISLHISSQVVVIETTSGNITIKLYDETPIHKENFLELVSKKYYDGLLFHRVIEDFMIQTGDSDSKNAKPGQALGFGGASHTIPAEFNKNYYHKKGALAAARQGDNINPNKESSGSQFYIVKGKVLHDKELDFMEQRGMHIKFTDEQRNVYKTIGGTPHLDYSYTVFGEVINGLEVIDKISSVETDKNNRPLEDVKIIKMYVKK